MSLADLNAATRQPATSSNDTVQRARFVRMRSVLFAFVLLILLPIWAFSGYLAWEFASVQKRAIEASAQNLARSIADALDFRITSIESAVVSLTVSSALRANDLAIFYREARAVARTQGVVLALVSPEGAQILNTNAPFGRPLPPTAPEARAGVAAATGQTQVSRVFFGNVTARWLVSIAVPVLELDEVRHVVVVGIDTVTQLGEVLGISQAPPGWTICLVDEQRTVMARRPHDAAFIGQPAQRRTADAQTSEASATNCGTSAAQGAQGAADQPLRLFEQRTRKANWTVMVSLPTAEFDEALSEALHPVILAGIFMLLTSLFLALMLGRRFNEQLRDVSLTAQAYRRGESPVLAGHSGIFEIAELQRTLTAAVAERSAHSRAQAKLLAEKDLLMQEVHHRVKNSLQLVRGVLNLQGRQAEHPEAKEALAQAAARILTVADVHQHLYQGASTAEAHVARYLADLTQDLASSMLPPDSGRSIGVEAPDLTWPSERLTALGLIVAELITNSVKHGAGVIKVRLAADDDGKGLQLVVEDEGPGFPEGMAFGASRGLGSRMIASLVRPEEGEVRIDRAVAHGRVVVTLNAGWRAHQRVA